jgi:hypothetical protein
MKMLLHVAVRIARYVAIAAGASFFGIEFGLWLSLRSGR